MDLDQLTRDMVDPIVTMTVAASGQLKNKRSRNDLDSIQVDEDKAGVAKKAKPTDNHPTMLVLTYASVEHNDGTVPPYYFILVNRMKKPEENICIAVFDDDNSTYELPPNKDDNRGTT